MSDIIEKHARAVAEKIMARALAIVGESLPGPAPAKAPRPAVSRKSTARRKGEFTTRLVVRIRDMHAAGDTDSIIAQKVGRAQTSVSRLLRRLGLAPHGVKFGVPGKATKGRGKDKAPRRNGADIDAAVSEAWAAHPSAGYGTLARLTGLPISSVRMSMDRLREKQEPAPPSNGVHADEPVAVAPVPVVVPEVVEAA
jgi:hypothetical protein